MAIECNEINQTANYLLTAFADCKKIKNEDLIKLVELILAIYNCQDEGPNYDTLITDVYTPTIENEIVTYEAESLHSISIMVISGSITENINSTTVSYTQGAVLNTHYSTLNENAITFTVNAGSTVVVKYLIENI